MSQEEKQGGEEPEEELTGEQIGRQDFVDNAIFRLVNELVPQAYRDRVPAEVRARNVGGEVVGWNMEWIAGLSGRIQQIIADALQIPEAERDAFEMAFYPYLAEGDE